MAIEWSSFMLGFGAGIMVMAPLCWFETKRAVRAVMKE